VFSFYACVQLIRGVKNVSDYTDNSSTTSPFSSPQRSSRQVRPYLILIGIETVLAFLYILNFTWNACLHAVFGTIVNGYVFICIHSLWEMFRDEAMRGHNRQYREATMIQKI
jgi:hypothetical protein